MKKRLILITQGVSRVVTPILTQNDVEVVGVVESAPRGYSLELNKSSAIRTIFQRGEKILWPAASLMSAAQKNNIPYFLLHKSNKTDLAYWIKEIKVDVVVVFSMSQLLPQEILDIPSIGVLNLHPSLLPAYRGANPWFWMYYDSVPQGGVTLHYVDAGEDTGDIVFQCTYDIPLGMRSPVMQDLAIGKHGVDLILKALKKIGQGDALPRFVQPEQSPTARARNIKPEEHRTLIDWAHWPIERVWHVMRGTELWLNCIDQPTGIYSGQRWVVGEFTKTIGVPKNENLGQVRKDSRGFYVQCRDGIVRIHVGFKVYPLLRHMAQKLLK